MRVVGCSLRSIQANDPFRHRHQLAFINPVAVKPFHRTGAAVLFESEVPRGDLRHAATPSRAKVPGAPGPMRTRKRPNVTDGSVDQCDTE